MKLRIPPLLLLLITGSMMTLLAHLFPEPGIPWPYPKNLAGLAALVGITFLALGVADFRKQKTTVNPLKPQEASALVTTGIYSRTRNPMYVGMLLLLAAWWILLQNLAAAIFLPIFMGLINRLQIVPEEEILRKSFGEPYILYCRNVPRWL